MESCAAIVEELRALGSPSIKKVLVNHGATEPFFGVKISDLKPIEKRLKPNYELALELYDTGISDAMYLAGLITEDAKMTREDLQRWVEAARWSLLSESTVPWVASGCPYGQAAALEWIESPAETIASAGWRTLSCITLVTPDARLDLPLYEGLLDRVAKTIHSAQNRVRYCMNGYIIHCGTNVTGFTEKAKAVATEVGPVQVFMGETACRVPDAIQEIEAAAAKGVLGKKKKTAKC